MKLYTPSEIEQIEQDIPHLIEITKWLNDFLAKPHPNLGRTGSVCPFVPSALKSNSIQMAVIHTKNEGLQQIEKIVAYYRHLFIEMAATKEDEFKINQAFILIFPDIDIEDAPQIIDTIQRKLKPLFVESGLMIGEFHGRTQSPGLHNPNFRPLRSPIPLLAIRFMGEFDLPFLQSPDDPHLRVRYLEAYLQRFSQQIKDEEKLQRICNTLAEAKKLIKN